MADAQAGATAAADAATTGQAPAATQTQQAAAQTQAQPGAQGKVEDLPAWAQGIIRDLRGENASHRQAKTAAEAAAQEAALAKAKAEGDWKALYEDAQKKAAEAARLAEEAKPYVQTVSAEVQALRAALGDKAATVPADLSPAQALPILRTIQALAAGKPAAPPPASAHPAPHASAEDLRTLSPDQLKERIARMTPDELRAHAATLSGGGPRPAPFSWSGVLKR